MTVLVSRTDNAFDIRIGVHGREHDGGYPMRAQFPDKRIDGPPAHEPLGGHDEDGVDTAVGQHFRHTRKNARALHQTRLDRKPSTLELSYTELTETRC